MQSRINDERDLLQRYGIDLATLREMHRAWSEDRVPKSVVEARFLRTRRHHGKLFNHLTRTYLGIETQERSSALVEVAELRDQVAGLQSEVDRLRQLLVANQVDPDAFTQQEFPL